MKMFTSQLIKTCRVVRPRNGQVASLATKSLVWHGMYFFNMQIDSFTLINIIIVELDPLNLIGQLTDDERIIYVSIMFLFYDNNYGDVC